MKSPPKIIVQLIHIQGGMKGQIQEFSDPLITIGRLPSLTLHFPVGEPGVSREHAQIERDGNQFRLVALKDKFGTFVNGKQVREAVLRNGDVIEFGSDGPKVSFAAEFGEPMTEPVAPLPEPQYQAADSQPHRAESQREEPCRPSSANGDAQHLYLPPLGEAPPPQRVSTPLVIQFGPTIRSYRELPVVLGAHPRCDFVLQERDILDQHAQIYFQQGSYYLKDLTGQRTLRVNGRPLDGPARLDLYDEFACSPHGPVFRFLGDGRLAEVETPLSSVANSAQSDNDTPTEPSDVTPPANFLSKLVKRLK